MPIATHLLLQSFPYVSCIYILEISNALPSIALDTVGLRVSTHTDPLLRVPTRLAA